MTIPAMLQLNLRFLEKQIARFAPPPSRPTAQDSPLLWKHGIAVHFVRQPRARRYLLRLEPDGTARLVIPRRGSRSEGLRFLERSEAWLLQQRARWQNRMQARQPWTDGRTFLFRGEEVVLKVETTAECVTLGFADQSMTLPHPQADYHVAVLDHLRHLARLELPSRARELARHHGISIQWVTVRAQKTRWGSCSSRGTISLNWRLVQAPPPVVDYLIIHELMHRRQMNHSARYWKLVANAFPDYRPAEQWLKKHRLELLD